MSNTAQNVDREEIAKFEKLADRWWDPNSEFRPLHQINPLRLQWIDQRAHLKGKTVLDVGCGGGILTESMATLGAKVTGIDMGKAPLAVAKLHMRASGQRIDYLHSTAEDLAETRPGAFDVVTCLEMLEHVPDPAAVVRACYELVKPGGLVFFATINRTPKSFLLAIIGAEYVLNLLPRGTHEYRKFIRPSELEEWAREAGLMMRELTGMHYNPLSRRYWLAPGVDVNYLAYTVRPDG
jgi:2-polyprenyl-6-hydroxyphenyl methylase/3-demethylubiquinone-9 3-methyltransferase